MPGRPGLALISRDAEQTHMSLGVRVPGRQLETPLGAVGAQHRPRRRPEFPAVPADPGDPRAGLLGVLDASTRSPTAARCRCTRPACRSGSTTSCG